MKNIKRKKYQDLAVHSFKKHNHVLLEYCTGLGKTLAALRCMDVSKKGKWYILCKERTHIDNWKEEIEKHNLTHLLDRCEFYCYASLKKLSGSSVEGVIFDEVHGAISEKRVSYIQEISFDKSVLLSATIDNDVLKQIHKFVKPCKLTVSLKEAIQEGILPEPSIFVHQLYLSNKEPTHVYTKTKGKKNEREIYTIPYMDLGKTLSKFKKKSAYELRISCNETQYYELISTDMHYYMYRQSYGDHFKFKFLNLASQRKRFLSSLKNNILVSLNQASVSKRRIVFCGSIEQAELLGKECIHSKKSSKEIQKVIKDFNEKRSNVIYTVYMARESINLVDIQRGIITQLDSKKKSYVQMVGRLLRGDMPEVHIIVILNTQDEKYFSSVTKNIPKEWFTYIQH